MLVQGRTSRGVYDCGCHHAGAVGRKKCRRFLEMADDATRARTRVIYCLEPPGADTYIFGVRLRPDGSFDEGDDPPETDG